MKLIKIVLFCLVSNLSFGQYIILTNATSNTSCDGSVIFNYPGFYQFQSGYVEWKKIVENDTILIQEGGFSLSNLCVGTYILEAKDSFFQFPSISTFKVISSSIADCDNFNISCTVSDPSDPDLFSTISTNVNNGIPPFNYYFDDIVLSSNNQINSYTHGSYDFGLHTFKVVDSLGCVDSLRVNLLGYDNCIGYLSMGFNYTNETVSYACDGTFQLVPVNFTDSAYVADNIQVNWDSGDTGFNISDLCPGFNFCTVFVQSIVPNVPSCAERRYIKIEDALDSVYVYGGFENTMNVLYSEWIDECSIDLTAIQSAEIIDFTFITSDSILVTWEVRDTNQVVAIIYAGYSIPNTSENYNFVLQLYCLQKSFPVYANAVDQYYIGELSVSTSTLEGVSIAPNPAENILNVKSKVDFETFVISDMRGKTVKSQNYSSEINIEDLQSGIYLLHLHHDENVVLVKFVKR